MLCVRVSAERHAAHLGCQPRIISRWRLLRWEVTRLLLRRSVALWLLLECAIPMVHLRIRRAIVLLTLARRRWRVVTPSLLVMLSRNRRRELRRSRLGSAIRVIWVELLALSKGMVHRVVGHRGELSGRPCEAARSWLVQRPRAGWREEGWGLEAQPGLIFENARAGESDHSKVYFTAIPSVDRHCCCGSLRK